MRRMRHKKLITYDEKLSDNAVLLDEFLLQYRDCITRKRALERRKAEIIEEFSPLKSPRFDGMPRGGNYAGIPAASLIFRVEEIEKKIGEQMLKAEKMLSEILKVIDFLPEETPEQILSKAIVENRYIDRMEWGTICAEHRIGRSGAIRHWKKGLYTLLSDNKVKYALKKHFSQEEVPADGT